MNAPPVASQAGKQRPAPLGWGRCLSAWQASVWVAMRAAEGQQILTTNSRLSDSEGSELVVKICCGCKFEALTPPLSFVGRSRHRLFIEGVVLLERKSIDKNNEFAPRRIAN